MRAGASFCRECGASEDSGWDDGETWADGELGPGYHEAFDDFDYDEYVRREFPTRASNSATQRRKHFFVAVIIILLCASLILWHLM